MNNTTQISEIFSYLNSNNIDFIILRKQELILENIENNDIDLLISFSDLKKVINVFKNKKLLTYTDNKFNNIYLYGAKPHKHFYNKELNINFDISFDISYKSINQREFIPINDSDLDYIWEKKIKIQKENFYYFKMDDNSQLTHLISHCIFNKNNFSDYYSKKIIQLLDNIDEKIFLKMLEITFYKFSKKLLELLKSHKFEVIFEDYLSFKEY